ncbi:protein kinase domain-containing protein [Ditylenchus destructor]|uniref:Protein kinase domain-containing protein n=1 Tax=Ditylenchus destructor TaxID=166010 RepID=A0AAD4QYN2_9BILA|nr:protein kinase domain-containing protein [Ditylenchus destructor]
MSNGHHKVKAENPAKVEYASVLVTMSLTSMLSLTGLYYGSHRRGICKSIVVARAVLFCGAATFFEVYFFHHIFSNVPNLDTLSSCGVILQATLSMNFFLCWQHQGHLRFLISYIRASQHCAEVRNFIRISVFVLFIVFMLFFAVALYYFCKPLLFVSDSNATTTHVAMELIEIAKSIHNGKGKNLGCAHRDIKLDNILLNESKSRLFLVDFGIAKPLYKDNYTLTKIPLNIKVPFCRNADVESNAWIDGAKTDMCQIATACIILLVGRCNYEGNRELTDKVHPLFFEFKRAMHALPDCDSPDYYFWMRKFKSSFCEEFDAEKNYFKSQAEEKFFSGFRPLAESLLDEL